MRGVRGVTPGERTSRTGSSARPPAKPSTQEPPSTTGRSLGSRSRVGASVGLVLEWDLSAGCLLHPARQRCAVRRESSLHSAAARLFYMQISRFMFLNSCSVLVVRGVRLGPRDRGGKAMARAHRQRDIPARFPGAPRASPSGGRIRERAVTSLSREGPHRHTRLLYQELPWLAERLYGNRRAPRVEKRHTFSSPDALT